MEWSLINIGVREVRSLEKILGQIREENKFNRPVNYILLTNPKSFSFTVVLNFASPQQLAGNYKNKF